MDRIAPSVRPDDRPAGFQRWRTLAFLHWEIAVEAIAARIPKELSVDTFEGRAYVGVVPFTMKDVSPWWAPSVPGVSNFHELNVRTYVHDRAETPGVWFFSLDAAGSIAVLAARAGWHLPYHRASMEMTVESGEFGPGREVRYRSKRLWPGPKPAELSLRYRIGEAIGNAVPGTFEHFLAERYVLFADTGTGLSKGIVHHKPYPLHRAEVLEIEQSMVQAAGLPAPVGAPLVLASPGVDVDVFALEKI